MGGLIAACMQERIRLRFSTGMSFFLDRLDEITAVIAQKAQKGYNEAMKKTIAVVGGAVLASMCLGSMPNGGGPMKSVVTVPGELDMLVKHGHIQGATCSEKAIYVSNAGGIAKIDWKTGGVLKTCEARPHLGDIAYANGRIYGAYALWDCKPGESPLMVGVWDEDLKPIMERRISSPGARGLDGAVVGGDTLYVGVDHYGEKRWDHPPHNDCTVMMLATTDLSVKGTRDIMLDYPIHYGVQTLGTDGTDLFFGNYGATRDQGNLKGLNFSRVTLDFKLRESRSFHASEGFGLVPKSVSGRDGPVFFNVNALGGNMQGWRKDPKGNPPRVRFDFYSFDPATGELARTSLIGCP